MRRLAFLGIALLCGSAALAQERHTAVGKYMPIFELGNKKELLGDRLSEAGKKDAARKAYVEAQRRYQHVLALQPDYLPVYARLSRIHGLLHQYLAGAALMKLGLQRYPNNAELKEALATHLTLGGYTRAGVPLLEEVAKAQPDNLAVQALLADHYLAHGPLAKAIRPLEIILDKTPEADRRRVELGRTQLRLGRFNDALATFRKVERGSPAFADAQIWVADALLQSEQPDAAFAAYQEAERTLRLSSHQQLELQLGMSECLRKLGRCEEALRGYRAFIVKSPRDSRGYYGAGECLRLAGRHREAIGQLEHALRLYGRSPRIYWSLARASSALGDTAGAVRWQESAVRLAPEDWRLASFLGRLQRWQKSLQKALETHRRLIAARPWSAELHAELGHDYFYLGQLGQAREEFGKAIGIDKGLTEARAGLVLVGLRQVAQLLQTRKMAEAAQVAEGLLQHRALGANVREFLGAIALEQGDAKKALEWLDLDKDVRGPGWRYLLLRGRAQLGRGDAKAALRTLRKIDASRLSRQQAGAVEYATAAAEIGDGDYVAATDRIERLAAVSKEEPLARLLASSLVARANHYWLKRKASLALADASRAAQMKSLLSPMDAARAALLIVLAAAETGQKAASAKALAAVEKRPVADAALENRYRGKVGKQTLRAIVNYYNGAFDLAANAISPVVQAKQAPPELKDLYAAILRARAHHLYEARNYGAARTAGQQLQRVTPNLTPADELLLACIGYNQHRAAALAAFRKLATRLPEAELDVGIYLDEVDKDKRAAYDAYVSYVRRGGGHAVPTVQKWIKTKQRVFGYK